MKKGKQLFCNKCGKQILIENDIAREDYIMVTKSWGYFSGKDGKRHRFCLCEKCYDEMTSDFVLPVLQEELTEFV